MKEEWLIQQEKEELATLTNLMLPTQAIKLLPLLNHREQIREKDSYKEKALTSSLDLTFLPLPFVAHSHRKEKEDPKSSLLQCLVSYIQSKTSKAGNLGTHLYQCNDLGGRLNPFTFFLCAKARHQTKKKKKKSLEVVSLLTTTGLGVRCT